ncbi:hypothetical protein [Corynebacterium amycolatum]|uniref:hypothetical protein n=1 Tax=Corynebacterium amycolatum TaxID=43765 RepID=UPI001F17868C|nr:hypothetical protein [Corynebacterium amycolatum]
MIPASDANRFIGALNRITEGVTMLAAAIEETAWEGFKDHTGMPGARPIAAAGLSSQGMTEQVRELLVATGADKLSAVDPTKYGWLLAKAKELSDA